MIATDEVDELGVRQQVIVACRQAEARLIDLNGVAPGVLRIRRDRDTDRGRKAGRAEQVDEVGLALCRCNTIEVRLQRLGAARLDSALIHPARVQVADLLPEPSVGRGVLGHILNDRSDVPLDLVIEHRIDAGEGAVGRDLGALVPAAIHIGEEVVTRLHRRVHCRRVISPGAVDRLRRLACGRKREQARSGKHERSELHPDNPSQRPMRDR